MGAKTRAKKMTKALITRKRICKELKISKHTFYRLVQAGLPVTKDKGGVWSGHKDQCEQFFFVNTSAVIPSKRST